MHIDQEQMNIDRGRSTHPHYLLNSCYFTTTEKLKDISFDLFVSTWKKMVKCILILTRLNLTYEEFGQSARYTNLP